MNNRKLCISLWMMVVACFTSFLNYAQPIIKTFVDKNEILIGQQLSLRIEASFDLNSNSFRWVNIPDSIAHFEVVNRGKVDTVYTGNTASGISQTFTLTSFDSGKWIIPPFAIGINPVKDDATFNYFTDSLPVTVSFSASDTTGQLKDIKPIREVETVNPLWYWIGGGIAGAAIIALLIWLYLKYKKKKPAAIPIRSKLSAYDEAMEQLKTLEQYDFTKPFDVKTVHTKLAEILKQYVSRRENNDYSNNTTGEFLQVLAQIHVPIEMLSQVAAAIKTGDGVKFAKYLPQPVETNNAIETISSLIKSFHQSNQLQQPKL